MLSVKGLPGYKIALYCSLHEHEKEHEAFLVVTIEISTARDVSYLCSLILTLPGKFQFRPT